MNKKWFNFDEIFFKNNLFLTKLVVLFFYFVKIDLVFDPFNNIVKLSEEKWESLLAIQGIFVEYPTI